MTLIIEALARHLGDDEPIDGFSPRKLRHYYLLNPEEDGKQRYKLLLTQTDEQTLLAIVAQRALPNPSSLRLKDNFDFFQERVNELGEDLVPLCKGLAKLMVVDISLSRQQDNPQLIFESMNSTGLALSQADLIRNFVLMGLKRDQQQRLYSEHWRPMELALWTGCLRQAFRQLHATLSDAQDRQQSQSQTGLRRIQILCAPSKSGVTRRRNPGGGCAKIC